MGARPALAQTVAWREAGWRLPVAVNINAQDLGRPRSSRPRRRARCATRAREPSELTLEITEHMAIATVDNVMGVLADLRRTGITVSIDDFGTGHSSLTRLRDLPVDELKLDRDLLRQSPSSQDLAITARRDRPRPRPRPDRGRRGRRGRRAARLPDLDGLRRRAGLLHLPAAAPGELERWVGTSPAGGTSSRWPVAIPVEVPFGRRAADIADL